MLTYANQRKYKNKVHHDNLVLQTLKDKPDINQKSKEIYAEKFGNIPIQERIDIDSKARIAMK